MSSVTEHRSTVAGAELDVEAIRADFPILRRVVEGKPLVYLDSAATSQKPQQVIDAVSDFYANHNANVHRGLYQLAEEATELYEGARTKLASFVGAPGPETIVFNRGTTESVNLIAHAWGRKFLHEGDEILITEMEHHSNIIPWQFAAQATGAMLRYIPVTDDGFLDLTDLEGGLINSHTKIVSVTGMSNVLGTLNPLRELADAAHAAGAKIMVDGAQLVPHAPVDVAVLDCDFLTISGHKMLGPTASGGLYAKREILEEMDPFLGGGEMISEVFPDHATFNEVPFKFEAGTMNIAEEIGLGAAIDYLNQVGMEAVHEAERQLTAYALEQLQGAGARIFGPLDSQMRGGAISFAYRDVHPHDLAEILNAEGVSVRAGHHCAQLLMRRYGVPATTRASFYLYNTQAEVDALIASLAKAAEVFG
jgi:cysteine desulfurase/selenocysteine lyase